jgi:hypothetical protein
MWKNVEWETSHGFLSESTFHIPTLTNLIHRTSYAQYCPQTAYLQKLAGRFAKIGRQIALLSLLL